MTVAELIAKLQAMPQDATVELVRDDGETMYSAEHVKLYGEYDVAPFVTIE